MIIIVTLMRSIKDLLLGPEQEKKKKKKGPLLALLINTYTSRGKNILADFSH
jgi:hypothetical protein